MKPREIVCLVSVAGCYVERTGMECNLHIWEARSDAPRVHRLPENIWIRLGRGREVDIEVVGDRTWSREQIDIKWDGAKCHVHQVSRAKASLIVDDEVVVEAWVEGGATLLVGQTVLEFRTEMGSSDCEAA
jgi:hypothetical protein